MEKEKYNVNYTIGERERVYREIQEEIKHKTFMKRLRDKWKQMENNIA
jgi:hypothetical protein